MCSHLPLERKRERRKERERRERERRRERREKERDRRREEKERRTERESIVRDRDIHTATQQPRSSDVYTSSTIPIRYPCRVSMASSECPTSSKAMVASVPEGMREREGGREGEILMLGSNVS